jgi:hypothetical protein
VLILVFLAYCHIILVPYSWSFNGLHIEGTKKSQFIVNTLSKSIAISIKEITSIPRLISRFPISLKNLIDLQQLYALFSWVDHLILRKPFPSIPAKRKIDKL